jgi:hypothetical protein
VREVMIQHNLATGGELDAKRRKKSQQNKRVTASNPSALAAGAATLLIH